MDAVDGGIIQLAVRLAPVLSLARVPLGIALTQAIRLVRPLAGPGLDLYAAVQPPGDKNLLARPEFKAMFLDDLLNGSRFQTSAPLNDLVLFTRDWGFTAADVSVPVRWWHGDADHIVPFAHGQHMVDRLPDATMSVIDGESHLGGLGIAERVITTLMDLGPRRDDTPTDGAFLRNAVSLVFTGPICHNGCHNYTRVTWIDSSLRRDRWGRRISTPEKKGVHGDRTHCNSPAGNAATRGVLFVHSAPSALCPHIEWAVGGVLGVAVSLDWTPQPAQSGSYRAELSWSGDAGSAAAVASALRGWDHLRFEITEEPTASSEGARYSYTPVLGVFHAVTGLHGDIMIPEDRLKAAVVKAALGDTTLLLEIDKLLGKPWDDELETFRHAGEGAPVRWLHQVV